MEDVISLSSDDSNGVEIISYREFIKSDPLPLSHVRVDIEAVNVNIPRRCIDHTDSRWAFPDLKLRRRLDFTDIPVIDLTESEETTELQTEKLPPNNDSLQEKGNTHLNTVSNGQHFKIEGSLGALKRSSPHLDSGDQKPKQRCLSSTTQPQEINLAGNPCHSATAVKQTRLPFLENCVTELKTSGCSVQLTKDSSLLSLCQLNNNSEAQEDMSNLETTALAIPHMKSEHPPEVTKSPTRVNGQELSSEQLQDKELQHLQCPADCSTTEKNHSDHTVNEHNTGENKLDGFDSPNLIPSSTFPPPSQSKAAKGTLVFKMEQMKLDKSESDQRCPSDKPPPSSSPSELISCEHAESDSFSHTSRTSYNHMSHVDLSPRSEQMPGDNTPEWQWERESYRDELRSESPVSLVWQGGSDEDEESRCGTDFRAVCREDRQFVCPDALKKVMSGPIQVLINEDYESFGPPEVLCRQSLSLVYSTIDENYTEGTLQLLSDLLQPGYYPPKDITSHLVRGILLEPQIPYHLKVQAFNLLMRTQRHHKANKSTVPWDWELLTSVMSNQEHARWRQCEVVRMLLEYIVQTLEDDFRAKCSTSALHLSIAKATLSCDRQFPRVKDVIKWLFSAIMKSTELGKSREPIRERDEQIRIVSLFQRMLSLALEVDRSPALNSAKLSQELFHTIISHVPLRAHRMLLLESLQSKLLKCKLLEQLLDYACPKKVSLPMSLSLLLHFLKNCSLAPDSTDGAERWKKWEELIHLIWMLMLSYHKAMKGFLSSNFTEQRGKVGTLVYKPDDMVTKPAVREAVTAFLSRSEADLGQALPLHVDESLTYLQDHLLDVCQC